MLHQRRQEIDIVPDPVDHERVQRLDLTVDRLLARRCPGDQLGDHGIVEHRHFAALEHAVIDAGVGLCSGSPARLDRLLMRLGLRRLVANEPPRAGQESPIRVLGIDAVLDRPASKRHICLLEGKLLARRDPNHLLDQIEPGHAFRHRMLDLQPGVHLEEVEALPVGSAPETISSTVPAL
jgi:hypothetical protein